MFSAVGSLMQLTSLILDFTVTADQFQLIAGLPVLEHLEFSLCWDTDRQAVLWLGSTCLKSLHIYGPELKKKLVRFLSS